MLGSGVWQHIRRQPRVIWLRLFKVTFALSACATLVLVNKLRAHLGNDPPFVIIGCILMQPAQRVGGILHAMGNVLSGVAAGNLYGLLTRYLVWRAWASSGAYAVWKETHPDLGLPDENTMRAIDYSRYQQVLVLLAVFEVIMLFIHGYFRLHNGVNNFQRFFPFFVVVHFCYLTSLSSPFVALLKTFTVPFCIGGMVLLVVSLVVFPEFGLQDLGGQMMGVVDDLYTMFDGVMLGMSLGDLLQSDRDTFAAELDGRQLGLTTLLASHRRLKAQTLAARAAIQLEIYYELVVLLRVLPGQHLLPVFAALGSTEGFGWLLINSMLNGFVLLTGAIAAGQAPDSLLMVKFAKRFHPHWARLHREVLEAIVVMQLVVCYCVFGGSAVGHKHLALVRRVLAEWTSDGSITASLKQDLTLMGIDPAALAQEDVQLVTDEFRHFPAERLQERVKRIRELLLEYRTQWRQDILELYEQEYWPEGRAEGGSTTAGGALAHVPRRRAATHSSVGPEGELLGRTPTNVGDRLFGGTRANPASATPLEDEDLYYLTLILANTGVGVRKVADVVDAVVPMAQYRLGDKTHKHRRLWFTVYEKRKDRYHNQLADMTRKLKQSVRSSEPGRLDDDTSDSGTVGSALVVLATALPLFLRRSYLHYRRWYRQKKDYCRFGLQVVLALMLGLFPMFIPATRMWYIGVHGAWVGFVTVLVLEVSVGATYLQAVVRSVGIVWGSLWGYLLYIAGGLLRQNLPALEVLVAAVGTIPTMYVMLTTPYFKGAFAAEVSIYIVLYATVLSPTATILRSWAERCLAMVCGLAIAVGVDVLVFPVRSRSKMRAMLLGALTEMACLEQCYASLTFVEEGERPLGKALLDHMRNQMTIHVTKARAYLAAAKVFQGEARHESRFKESFQLEQQVVTRMLTIMPAMVDRMENTALLRDTLVSAGNPISVALALKVVRYRRQSVASTVLLYRATGESMATKSPLPQCLPSAKLAYWKMAREMRLVFSEALEEQRRAERRHGVEGSDDDDEAYVQTLARAKHLRRAVLGWSITAMLGAQVGEQVDELIWLVRLLVGVLEFRSGFLSRLLLSKYALMAVVDYRQAKREVRGEQQSRNAPKTLPKLAPSRRLLLANGPRLLGVPEEEGGEPPKLPVLLALPTPAELPERPVSAEQRQAPPSASSLSISDASSISLSVLDEFGAEPPGYEGPDGYEGRLQHLHTLPLADGQVLLASAPQPYDGWVPGHAPVARSSTQRSLVLVALRLSHGFRRRVHSLAQHHDAVYGLEPWDTHDDELYVVYGAQARHDAAAATSPDEVLRSRSNTRLSWS